MGDEAVVTRENWAPDETDARFVKWQQAAERAKAELEGAKDDNEVAQEQYALARSRYRRALNRVSKAVTLPGLFAYFVPMSTLGRTFLSETPASLEPYPGRNVFSSMDEVGLEAESGMLSTRLSLYSSRRRADRSAARLAKAEADVVRIMNEMPV